MTTQPKSSQLEAGLIRALKLLIVIALPYLLVVGNARLVMNESLLAFEYSRAGFPMDTCGFGVTDLCGFTTEERIEYGVYGIRYILNSEDIRYLGDLTLPGELCYPRSGVPCPMFNDAELHHMKDVKNVAQGLFTVGMILGVVSVLAGVILWQMVSPRMLAMALLQGSLLTLGLIAAIIVFAITAWDFFFTAFHALFFEDGTWRFYFSDTLIRLYPEQFWFDAAVLIGVMTVVFAGIIAFVSWRSLGMIAPRRDDAIA